MKASFLDMIEDVKYGGIVSLSGAKFCGVFAYEEHVSAEFRIGLKLLIPIGFLKGSVKVADI